MIMNDVNEKDSNEAATPARSTKKIRLILLLLILAVAAGIYWYHQRPLSIDGWDADIDAAMKQAKEEQRPVVIFFVGRTPSQIARDITKKVIPKDGNKKALAEGKFIKVIVAIDSGLKCDIAKKYKLVTLPTLIAFDPTGTEYNRLEGTNAKNEVGFRDKLLKAKK
jgi:zona occludens toxin (predicted ATPase)